MGEPDVLRMRPTWARRVARQGRRLLRATRVERFDVRWVFPIVALAAPIMGRNSASFLQACLIFGAVAGLWGALRTGAVWWIMAWCLVTGALGTWLALADPFAFPLPQHLAWATCAVQAVALLGVAAPATVGAWRDRAWVLLAMVGPIALGLLTIGVAPAWGDFRATAAVFLILASLPWALKARRRAEQ